MSAQSSPNRFVGIVQFRIPFIGLRDALQHFRRYREIGSLLSRKCGFGREIALLIAAGAAPHRTSITVEADFHCTDQPIRAAGFERIAYRFVGPYSVRSDKRAAEKLTDLAVADVGSTDGFKAFAHIDESRQKDGAVDRPVLLRAWRAPELVESAIDVFTS